MINLVRCLRLIPYLTALTVCALSLELAATPVRADLRFDQLAVNVGEVRSGKPLSTPFSFVNDGPDTVEITDMRASCGCLTPRLAQRLYQVGEKGQLVLEVQTLSQPAGTHTWSIQLSYRTGNNACELTLQVNAQVITEVMVQPAKLVVLASQPLTHEMTVTDLRPQPFAITAVNASSVALKPSLAEAGRDAQGHWTHKIKLAIGEPCPEGRYEEFVSIYTDDPGYRELKVPVTIVKRASQRVSATPSTVTLSPVAGQPVPSRLVLLRDRDQQEVRIDRVEADHPALTCKWSQGANPAATVRISVERNRIDGGSLQSSVRVLVSQPVQETVIIPVSCVLP